MYDFSLILFVYLNVSDKKHENKLFCIHTNNDDDQAMCVVGKELMMSKVFSHIHFDFFHECVWKFFFFFLRYNVMYEVQYDGKRVRIGKYSLWMDSSVFDSENKLEISLYTDSTLMSKKFKEKLFFKDLLSNINWILHSQSIRIFFGWLVSFFCECGYKKNISCLFIRRDALLLSLWFMSFHLTSNISYEIWQKWQVDKSGFSFINHQLRYSFKTNCLSKRYDGL